MSFIKRLINKLFCRKLSRLYELQISYADRYVRKTGSFGFLYEIFLWVKFSTLQSKGQSDNKNENFSTATG